MDMYIKSPTKRSSGDCDKLGDAVSQVHETKFSEYVNGQRYRTNSQVSFTIGDSSDCDSVSTTTSNSIFTSQNNAFQYDNASTNCCNGNPWHKFHFHEHTLDKTSQLTGSEIERDGDANSRETDDNSDDGHSGEEVPIPGRRTRGVSLTTTTRMIPNSPNDSLARLSDIDNLDNVNEDNCSRNWGKWRILITCAIVQMFSALMVSLQAPFYPAEAEKKGASATEYGFVFGAFELTVFLVSPIYGSRARKWNPKLLFNLGIFTAAISSITFGILDKIEHRKYFIAACALVRALEALGECAVVTATFVIVASAFSDSVAPTFAVLETFYSVGLISGPIVGSLLYQIGGYYLPFISVGCCLLVTALVSFALLPSSKEISQYRGTEPIIISSYKSFRLLRSTSVLVSAICIVTGAMSISYLQATLEPHLRQFNLSQLSVGAILVINGAVYTITAPFYGILCEKVVQLKLITFCGSALLICGYSLVGPIPILQFQPTVWIIALGLTLQGLGLGALLVASFVSILRSVIVDGLPDTPSTYGLVSSLWTSMFSLGSFFGPSLSGILYDSVGFANGTISIIAISLIMMCILVLFVCISDAEMESFNYSENEPLLSSSLVASVSLYSENLPNDNASTTTLNNERQHRNSYGTI